MQGPVKSDMSWQSWATNESTMGGSHFSDEMSDEVTIEQQRKEELAAMEPPSEGSVASGSSRRTEQWVDETCRERTNEAEEEWPNSNMTNEPAAEGGCSPAPLGEEANSRLQAAVDQDLTYMENTNYPGPQGSGPARGITRVCAYGKHKRVRPPMVNAGERHLESPRTRSVAGSVASSPGPRCTRHYYWMPKPRPSVP